MRQNGTAKCKFCTQSYTLSVTWDDATLEAVVRELRERRGDSTGIEVKSAAGGVPSLGDTLCAFSNLPDGGTIILGLDEARGFIPVGLGDIAGLEGAVASMARTSVTPPARCEFQTLTFEGALVLVAHVEGLPLAQRPARHGGIAYLRQSDGDYAMSEQEIAQIELLKTQALHPTNPDRTPIPESSATELDPDLLTRFLSAVRAGSRRYATLPDEKILHYVGVTTRSGKLTLAGLYALGNVPQSWSPSLGVTAAVQLADWGGGPRTRDLVHFVGPIPDLLSDTMEWVERNTRSTMGYDERGHGVDQPELPMRAVREIIANALVHRNLDPITGSKRVEIRLMTDRLVVTNPGGLWGVSEGQLGRPGAKSAVNPTLYEVCKNTRLYDGSRVIEGEGGGIREAIEVLAEAGLPAPRFIDRGIAFTVVIHRDLPRRPGPGPAMATAEDGKKGVTRHGSAVLAALTQPRTMTELKRETGLTEGQLRFALRRLQGSGQVEMRGARGIQTTRYESTTS